MEGYISLIDGSGVECDLWEDECICVQVRVFSVLRNFSYLFSGS